MLSKKAQLKFYQILIIAVIFLLIFIPFMIEISRKAGYEGWKAACITSVKTNIKLRKISSIFADDIKCLTLDITIEDNLDRKEGQNAAKIEIMKLMADCWEIYQKGKADLFTDENTYCAICAIFDFKDKNKEIKGLPGKDIDYSGTIDSNKIYGTIFIYAKGEKEIEEFKKNLVAETNAGRTVAYIGPHIDIEWNAATLFGEYTREELDKIGCKAIPIKQ